MDRLHFAFGNSFSFERERRFLFESPEQKPDAPYEESVLLNEQSNKKQDVPAQPEKLSMTEQLQRARAQHEQAINQLFFQPHAPQQGPNGVSYLALARNPCTQTPACAEKFADCYNVQRVNERVQNYCKCAAQFHRKESGYRPYRHVPPVDGQTRSRYVAVGGDTRSTFQERYNGNRSLWVRVDGTERVFNKQETRDRAIAFQREAEQKQWTENDYILAGWNKNRNALVWGQRARIQSLNARTGLNIPMPGIPGMPSIYERGFRHIGTGGSIEAKENVARARERMREGLRDEYARNVERAGGRDIQKLFDQFLPDDMKKYFQVTGRGGALWVESKNGLVRIEPNTNEDPARFYRIYVNRKEGNEKIECNTPMKVVESLSGLEDIYQKGIILPEVKKKLPANKKLNFVKGDTIGAPTEAPANATAAVAFFGEGTNERVTFMKNSATGRWTINSGKELLTKYGVRAVQKGGQLSLESTIKGNVFTLQSSNAAQKFATTVDSDTGRVDSVRVRPAGSRVESSDKNPLVADAGSGTPPVPRGSPASPPLEPPPKEETPEERLRKEETKSILEDIEKQSAEAQWVELNKSTSDAKTIYDKEIKATTVDSDALGKARDDYRATLIAEELFLNEKQDIFVGQAKSDAIERRKYIDKQLDSLKEK